MTSSAAASTQPRTASMQATRRRRPNSSRTSSATRSPARSAPRPSAASLGASRDRGQRVRRAAPSIALWPSRASRSGNARTSSARWPRRRPPGATAGDGVRHAEDGLRLAEELGDPASSQRASTTLAEITFWRTGRIQRDLLERAIEHRASRRRSIGDGADDARVSARPGRPIRGGARCLGRSDRRGDGAGRSRGRALPVLPREDGSGLRRVGLGVATVRRGDRARHGRSAAR